MKASSKQLLILSFVLAIVLMACTDYGKKVKHGHIEVYYKDGITEEVAQKTADLFFKIDKEQNNDTIGTKSIQLIKNSDTVLFRMVADKKKLEKLTDEPFIALANVFSDSLYKMAPVNVELTDENFKTFHHITFQKMDLSATTSFGNKVTSGNIELFCGEQIDNKTCNQLVEYLNTFIHPESVISFQFTMDENRVFVVKMVTQTDKANDITRDNLIEICKNISDNVFNSAPVTFQLADDHFKPIKTFVYPSDLNK